MGSQAQVKAHAVFDTNTVVSALLFAGGNLAWLREHWRSGTCKPLVSRVTASELTRVLAYPKFGLSQEESFEFLGDYLPFCEVHEPVIRCPVLCRDPLDQPFLDLAQSAGAGVLVTGDKDLLVLRGKTKFAIESPAAYRARITA